MIRRSLHVGCRVGKRDTSSTEWLKRQRNDPYVQKSRADGYRARSAYKLIEMNEKYNGQLLGGPGAIIMECGAAPGAWTQVAAETVNAGGNYCQEDRLPAGAVLGCDLLDIEPVPGAILFSRCDFTLNKNQQKILEAFGKSSLRFDVILSDMAPNASGQRQIDQERIINLSYSALRFALLNSYKGSNFVTKVWAGPRVDNLLMDLQKFYKNVERVKPQASRKDSGEIYLVAQDFKGIKQKAIHTDP